MTIRLHRGDLPDLSRYRAARSRSTPRPWGSIRTATGSAWCSSRPATAPPTWCRSRRARRRAQPDEASRRSGRSSRSFISPASISASLYRRFGVMPAPVYCTKIASRLARTYTDKHGLKDLVREVLGVDLSKQQQIVRLGRRGAHRRAGRLCGVRRAASACAEGQARRHAGARGPRPSSPRPASASCPTGSRLDLAGWAAEDIFAHS